MKKRGSAPQPIVKGVDMKIKYVVEFCVEVPNLAEYGATTLEEVVNAQQAWIDNGDADLALLMDASTDLHITVSGVED